MINTLLAKVEHGTSTFNRMIGDYAMFFKNKQGMFEGIKNFYFLGVEVRFLHPLLLMD